VLTKNEKVETLLGRILNMEEDLEAAVEDQD